MSIKGGANRRLFSFYLCVWKCLFFLSFLPSSLTSFSILPNLKLSGPCLLASITGDENLMLFSSVVNPLFPFRTFLGGFFFLMPSDMKFQDNMSGFFNFFFLDILGSILKAFVVLHLCKMIFYYFLFYFFCSFWDIELVFVSFLYFFLHSSKELLKFV